MFKNVLIAFLATLVVALAFVYAYRKEISEAYFEMLVADMFVVADDDDFDPGPKIGSVLPELNANFQGRRVNDLLRFQGPRGLVVVLVRSLDWCIFCKSQALELNRNFQLFSENGLGLAMLIPDDARIRESFTQSHLIMYPVLSDNNAESAMALEVLDKAFHPDDLAYGAPYPGAIVIDAAGAVAGKLFLEVHRQRLSSQAIVAKALEWLPATTPMEILLNGEGFGGLPAESWLEERPGLPGPELFGEPPIPGLEESPAIPDAGVFGGPSVPSGEIEIKKPQPLEPPSGE